MFKRADQQHKKMRQTAPIRNFQIVFSTKQKRSMCFSPLIPLLIITISSSIHNTSDIYFAKATQPNCVPQAAGDLSQ